MRKYLWLSILVCSIALLSCSSKETRLILHITEDPVGGTNIPLLTCSFEGKLYKGTTHIEATVEWWWSTFSGSNVTLVHREKYTFTGENYVEYTTEISAGANYVFYQIYWVKILWKDEDGTEHEIESSSARCNASRSMSNTMQRGLERRMQK
jgi:hypothetical protein